MARVLFYTGLSLLAVSAALLYLPTYFSFILAIIISALLIFLIIFHKKIVFNGLKFLLGVLLLFIITGLITHSLKIKPAEQMVGYDAEIVGTVCDYPIHYDTYSVYFVETEQITLIEQEGKTAPPNIPQKLKLRLSDINKIGADVFDKLHLTVQFNDLDIYRSSSLANKVYAGGYIVSLEEKLGENRPFYACFYDFGIGENLCSLLGEGICGYIVVIRCMPHDEVTYTATYSICLIAMRLQSVYNAYCLCGQGYTHHWSVPLSMSSVMDL